MRAYIFIRQVSQISALVGLVLLAAIAAVLYQQPVPVRGATNGKIAFTRSDASYEIDTMNADGTNVQSIANDAAMPVWSPDGTQIAYVDQPSGSSQIFIMDPDGSHKTQVTHTSGPFVAEPTWSPDGTKLAFLCSDGADNQICTVNADGTNETIITTGSGVFDGPDWSVTNKIAYICDGGTHSQICTINPDGTGNTQVTSDAIDHDWPRWSNDGSKLAYVEQGTLYVYKLAIINADGTGLQHINTTDNNIYDLSWSPDNTKLIYSNQIDGTDTSLRIYSIKIDGTSETALSPNDGVFSNWASWQPVVTNDQDGDGSLSTAERAAPNNGDANNDGIGDFVQANVTSVVNSVTGRYVTLQSNCSLNTSVSAAATPRQDSGFTYPNGMLSFTLHCASPGVTATVTQYFHGVDLNSTFVLRKYNASTSQFQTVPGATITSTTIGGSTVTKVTYQITDGGALDQDGSTNSVIVDPVGVALPSAIAPNTGLGGLGSGLR